MKRKTIFFVLLLYAALSNWCFSQSNPKIDSLERVLKSNIQDTVRVKTIFALAEETYLSQPAATLKRCQEGLALAQQNQFMSGISAGYGWLAYLYEQQGNIDQALAYYEKSLALFEQQKNKKEIGTCLNNIAAIYKDQGRIDEALRLHQQSLVIKKEIGDRDGIATSYNNIGLIYFNQGKIQEALDYYMNALKIWEKSGASDDITSVLQNIGSLYKDQAQYPEAMQYYRRCLDICRRTDDQYSLGYVYNMIGKLYDEQSKPDSSLIYYQEALRIRQHISDRQGASHTLKNVGNVFEQQGRWQEAKTYYTKSLQGFEEIGDKWGIAIAANKLGGLILHQEHQYALAGKYLQRSLQLSRELGYPGDIRNAAENLQYLYRQQQDWKSALSMNDLYIKMRDSVLNDNSRKSTLKTQLRYEYELKESAYKSAQEKKDAIAKAKIARQELIRNVFITGFIIALLLAAFIWRQRRRISIEKQRSDTLLLNILPAETARELQLTGEAKAKRYDQVTVMFTDFINFTIASEHLSPEDLVTEINRCYSEFDKIMVQHGIEKIKTIGDSYMAAAGLPATNQTHARDMVRAALEILAFTNEYFKTSALGAYGGGIRIGIHTGPVVAGIVGINKFAYDIWGDTVNIASRMESGGEPGRINISGATMALLDDAFKGIYRGKIGAKNKGEIDMYFVEASS